MVNTCSDPKCDSGCKGSSYEGSFFQFPTETTNNDWREKWKRAFPVKNWTPSRSSRLCDRHFSLDMIENERQDHKQARKDARGDLQNKYLKKCAIPHIWPEWPAYCSKDSCKQRSPTTTADVRKSKEDNGFRVKQTVKQIRS